MRVPPSNLRSRLYSISLGAGSRTGDGAQLLFRPWTGRTGRGAQRISVVLEGEKEEGEWERERGSGAGDERRGIVSW